MQDLPFKLTNGQLHALKEINSDLKSDEKMFRVLQGDVGSGKTIVAMLSLANIIESKYQCALMSPTEILARQHYELAKKIFKNKDINIDYLSGKTEPKEKRQILKKLEEGKIDFLIGTMLYFKKKLFLRNWDMW